MEMQLFRQAEELQEAGQRKDEFLAMLAHELRNPLAPLANTLQIIRMQDKGNQFRGRVARCRRDARSST